MRRVGVDKRRVTSTTRECKKDKIGVVERQTRGYHGVEKRRVWKDLKIFTQLDNQ